MQILRSQKFNKLSPNHEIMHQEVKYAISRAGKSPFAKAFHLCRNTHSCSYISKCYSKSINTITDQPLISTTLVLGYFWQLSKNEKSIGFMLFCKRSEKFWTEYADDFLLLSAVNNKGSHGKVYLTSFCIFMSLSKNSVQRTHTKKISFFG